MKNYFFIEEIRLKFLQIVKSKFMVYTVTRVSCSFSPTLAAKHAFFI
jgi:hypothetical protein